MTTQGKRIALNCSGGYVSGLNAVISGVVLAANKLGCRDGFDGLLFLERSANGEHGQTRICKARPVIQ